MKENKLKNFLEYLQRQSTRLLQRKNKNSNRKIFGGGLANE